MMVSEQLSQLSYIVSELFCLALAVNLLWKLKSGSEINRDIRNLRNIIFDYLILCITDILFAVISGAHAAVSLIMAVSISSAMAGCYLWYRYTYDRLYPERAVTGWKVYAEKVPAAGMCLLNLISAFTGWVFYIDKDGNYQEGPLFWIQVAVSYAYLLTAMVNIISGLIKTDSKTKKKECTTYIVYIIIASAIETMEDCFPHIPMLEFGVYLVIQNIFLNLYVEAERKFVRKKRELNESRISIMLSQIQPHFIYNVLAVIQDMCHGKAPEAEQVTMEFARYLRGNIDSLGQRDLIPFEKELDHTKSYLALEKKRFGDDILHVEYDITAKDFRLPALTLQPIAENAVHYGVMKRECGGSIRISTEETDVSYIIKVTDDGDGFDPAQQKNDGLSHVGITNVRGRLKEMCGGSLNIISAPGAGTTAEIIIPRNK